MARCIKCGKSFALRGKIKLNDADICFSCFKELGFDPSTDIYNSKDNYSWEDIKDGRDLYYKRRKAKHEQWMKDHPWVQDVMDALDGVPEKEPDEDPDEELDYVPF